MVLAACTSSTTPTAAPQATQASAATQAPANTQAPAATDAPTGGLKEVPRNQTAFLGWSVNDPIGTSNPWATGYTHQAGNVFMWEPLMYFAIFADKEIPWLADSMEYTKDDFTELTIKLNADAAWSDGTPVTSKDVKFTFDGQKSNDKLAYHAAFEQFVDSVATPDDKTVVVTFKIPAPRFAFEVLMLKFDTGIPIVPEHVLGNTAVVTDVVAYAGGLDMPHSGPYTIVVWDENQKILDLREDWWAVKAGRIATPAVKRIVMVDIGGQVGENMNIVVQRLVNNEFDAILDVRSGVAKQILDENPKVTTHTGSDSPYGYLDWWPNSLWMNTQIEPFNDARVRRAMSLAINRDQIDEILYEGSKVTSIYPFPLYPGLQKFADSAAVKALEAQYEPRKFDLEGSAALMTEAGFTKNGDDLWEKDGATVPAVINGFPGIHGDIVPILVEMLIAAGFDADVDFGTEAYNNMANGNPGLYMFGHGASLVDPYAALELFHGRFSASIGTTAGNNRFSRYSNPEYDAILDEMAPLSSDDPKFQELAAQALGIYWRDQIDIPIIQWLHRIPYNQTYWTNWPTTTNLAMGTNGAFWAHTGLLVITSLQPAQ
jgi:ABC-type transport system substrate-binding protein